MMRFRTLTCDCLLLSVQTHTVCSKNRKCFAIFLFPHLNKKEKIRIHLIFQCEDYVAKDMALEEAVEIYRKQVVWHPVKIDD